MLVAFVVTVIWGLATLVSMVTRDYTPLATVTPVMLIVVGGLMAAWQRNGRNGAASNH